MVLKAFDEAEIDMMYKKKLQYVILKYEEELERAKQLDIVELEEAQKKAEKEGRKLSEKEIPKHKETFELILNEKYMRALKYFNGSIDYRDFDDIVEKLESSSRKYEYIKRENEVVIDEYAKVILEGMEKKLSNMDNDIDKCRFLYEYVCTNIKPNSNAYKYNFDIPYADSYAFEFSRKGVPLGDSIYSTLVLKTGTINEIAGLLEFLGKKFNVPILSIPCTYNDNVYMLNAYDLDAKNVNKTHDEKTKETIDPKYNLSYIDANAVINGDKNMEDAFLVDIGSLNVNGFYDVASRYGFGANMDVNYSKKFDFSDLNITPEIEYVPNRIFGRQK